MELEDKEDIREKANEITNKLFKLINKEAASENLQAPQQSVYLLIHVAALLNAKICIATEGFGKTYNVDKLDITSVFDWLMSHTKTYIGLLESSNK